MNAQLPNPNAELSKEEGSAPLAPHNSFHRQCVARAREAALWAALTGLELMPIQLALGHGGWLAWVAQSCEFSDRTARRYLGAANRAIAALGDFGVSPGAADREGLESIKVQIVDMLEHDHLDEQRAALIASIQPAEKKKAKLRLKPRAPRPPLPPLKVAQRFTARIRTAPPEIQTAIFTDLRPDYEAWLQTQAA